MLEKPNFDKAILARLSEVARDEADLHFLLGEFATSTRKRILAIKDTSASDTIRRLAHPLKSSAATIGANGFAQLCRTIEQACQEGRTDEALQLISSLESEFSKVLDWLQQETGFSESV